MKRFFNRRTRIYALLAALVLAAAAGCQSADPHVVAKVIMKDDGHVQAELSSEWR